MLPPVNGTRGNILKWFKSYLNERQQYVNLQGTESQIKCVTCGVPQGSIIGPLLFILYINDMANVSNKIFPILFADDTTVLIEGNNLDVIMTSLNSELDRINTWLKSNKLSLNVTKTHYMVFHRARRKVSRNKLFINNSVVTQVSCSKFLGIILDNKLNWNSHIAYIKNKIAKGMGILLKARKVLKRSVLHQLYYSYIFPYLIYCSEVWGTASQIHLLPLIKLQKKIIRIISFSPYNSPTKSIFEDLEILPFKKLVFHRIGLQMYKYEYSIIPVALQYLFSKNSSVHEYNTRNRNKLRPAIAKHVYRDKDFRFVSVHVWNYISKNISIDVSFPSFKKSLKLFIFSEDFNFKI